jgi:hypothetical protein
MKSKIYTSNFPSPAFDREAIEKHFNLLHERAVGIDGLIPVVAICDGDIKVHQFPVGDPKRSTEIIMSYEGVSNCNIYTAWAVMRPDLRPDERGKETDVVAVLAAVSDLDTDKGESVRLENLPIKPSLVVESSEGNFQPVYIFEKPLPQEKAKPTLTALSQIVGGMRGRMWLVICGGCQVL